MEDLFGEVISSYSYLDAIKDGVFIDVSKVALEAGWRFPVALTKRLHSEVITPDKRSVKHSGQSYGGRLHDVLTLMKIASKSGGETTNFQVQFIMKRAQKRNIKLKAVCGPKSRTNPAPCITVMLHDED